MCGSGLVARAREAGLDCPDAAAVFAFAAKGEMRARALVDHMADRLGAALATAVNLLNPEVVVVGGGVAQAGGALLEPVQRALERYALASHRRGLRVVPAALGERAGVTGAGIAGWEVALDRLRTGSGVGPT
jgi:glucokinase